MHNDWVCYLPDNQAFVLGLEFWFWISYRQCYTRQVRDLWQRWKKYMFWVFVCMCIWIFFFARVCVCVCTNICLETISVFAYSISMWRITIVRTPLYLTQKCTEHSYLFKWMYTICATGVELYLLPAVCYWRLYLFPFCFPTQPWISPNPTPLTVLHYSACNHVAITHCPSTCCISNIGFLYTQ